MRITHITTAPAIARCAAIWLEASCVAHDFIAPEFWQSNLAAMQERYLPASTVYAAETRGHIPGFAAVHQGSLAALFVSPGWWGKGVGHQLLRHVQSLHSPLDLCVYAQNSRAVRFYLNNGFSILREQTCPQTHEPELFMSWEKQDGPTT